MVQDLGRRGQSRDKESRSHTKGQGQDKRQIHGLGGNSNRQGLQVFGRSKGSLEFRTRKTEIRTAFLTNVIGQGRTHNFGTSIKHVEKVNHIVGCRPKRASGALKKEQEPLAG